MNVSKEREKLFNAIIYFCNHTNYCHKLKLMKLLYYLDFWHFKETGKSVTNLNYKAWEMGPVSPKIYFELKPENNPSDLEEFLFIEEEIYDEINDKKRLIIKPKKDFNNKVFTKREIKILNKVSEVFRDAKGNLMTDSTHLKNSPWEKTKNEKGENQIIDYELSLDDESNSLSIEIVRDKIHLDNENKELLNSI
jgi:uncharacterized phage-associated protein